MVLKSGELLDKVYNVQNKLLVLLLSVVALMVFIQVLLRYFFRIQLFGIEELVNFPAMWLYFLGAANASLERSQLRAPIIDVIFKSPKSIKLFEIVQGLLSLILSVWFTYWAYQYTCYLVTSRRASPTLYIPLIFFDIAIIICFILMDIYLIVEINKNIRDLKEY